MNRVRLIRRSLVHFRRTHAGVVVGAAIGAAVLTGALVLGDSVRHTLRAHATARIGRIDVALATHDRFLLSDLGTRLTEELPGARTAPLLQVRGVASTTDGARSAGDVRILGTDQRFFDLAPTPGAAVPPVAGAALISERLADQLEIRAGQEIVIRVEQPSALPRDSVLGTIEDLSLALRITVSGIVDDPGFGRFSLRADQVPSHNVFVPLEWLQSQLGQSGRANLLLIDAPDDASDIEAYAAALARSFDPGDAQLDLVESAERGDAELTSQRIFIDPEVERAVAGADAALQGILTYFVNAIEHGPRSTPYSMVTALGPLRDRRVSYEPAALDDLADDEIVINDWLAEDLRAGVGDSIQLRYFVLDARDRLAESTATFIVRAIAPMTGLAADRTLMPPFPGVADAENSRDWEPGIPIDLGRIRDKDEDYWDAHRGTPKAFISLSAGRRLWSNRYGGLTAVRFTREELQSVRVALERELAPSVLGFSFQDVRAAALAASRATTDFGGLFLGLSLFLIVAALLLTSLLFVFNTEQRAREIGTLLAVGFRPRTVLWLLLGEGAALAVIGGVIGGALAIGYTRLILAALAGVWRQAVASASIELAVVPGTLATGIGASVIAALIAMRLTLGRLVRREPVAMLAGALIDDAPAGRRRRPMVSMVLAGVSLLAAIGIALSGAANERSAAPAFFGAGALLLVSTLAFTRVSLLRLRQSSARLGASLAGLALRNTSRRPGRTLATISLLACGVFLVVAIAVNRLDSARDADRPDSGAGGFAFIGESTIPILYDLNERRGRDAFGLTDDDLRDVAIVPLRVRDGDDASCLNLNVAQSPRLLGVEPSLLAERGAFRFVRTIDQAGAEPGWSLLNLDLGPGVIPAIADDASATWAMHKAVGDTLDYADEQGRPIRVMIVGTIANSILQGSLIIAEDRFRELFPSQFGHRMILIDAPLERREQVAGRLGRALSDVGLQLTPAARRLDDFNAVQNTYLAIFQILGALGLLLGSAGLGIVVVRNVLERRGELALLRAVGFNVRDVRRLIRDEHLFILAFGIAWGVLSAVIAVVPAFRGNAAEFPAGFTLAVLVLLAVNGLLWVALATRLSVSGPLANALRDE